MECILGERDHKLGELERKMGRELMFFYNNSNTIFGMVTSNRKECDETAGCLRKAGILAKAYHAGLGDTDRIAIQEQWINEDRCKVRNPRR